MNNKLPVDIIIPWVNPSDKSWQSNFAIWKKKEEGVTSANRFRDLESIKYALRSIDENAKFVRYVFLVLSDESQIPEWLNIENPKLRIVYHRDYIPSKLLPTFNSNTIIMHMSNIGELSENFILMNDDLFFMKPTSENYFFENNKAKGRLAIDYNGYRPTNGNYFLEELNNNARLINENIGKLVSLKHYHMPLACDKQFWEFCWYKNKTKLDASFTRFRSKKNYTDWFFNDLGLLTSHIVNTPGMYDDCCFICCTNYPDFRRFDRVRIACFNDDMDQAHYEKVKREFNLYMGKKFPRKSSFEK